MLFIFYIIFETRIFRFVGIQKNIVYNGVKNDTLTGTAQGVRFVIVGLLFFLIGLPIVFEYFKMNNLGYLYLLSIIWSPGGVCLWWGL
ncbi:hypothetical protein NL43_00240 [Methanosphaera sp. WGK6]|nr:hypothetical protein NL43_00240 [Methanosphaera sp. WGK6]